MQKTRKVLLAVLWCSCALAGFLIIIFETGIWMPGALSGNAKTEFALTVSMELLTLLVIPLSLWLFKWRRVDESLRKNKEKALLRWGLLRLLMLCLPFMACVLLYYLFVSANFGFLAIVYFLCLFFVYPSMRRCMTEIGE